MAALAQQALPIALVYQADALHRHLKQALTELGANVVYEAHAREFDHGALDASGAAVVLINLDPEASDEFEALGDLLVDETRRVVFNDGEVSSALEGWDLARWTRHLAAKVLGVEDVNPPRPAGAEAIPIRVKAVPSALTAALPSASNAPRFEVIPEQADSFELGGAELAEALAADTSVMIGRTRAALVTDEEPVAADLIARPSGDVSYDVDADELTMHLPEAASVADMSHADTLALEAHLDLGAAIELESSAAITQPAIELKLETETATADGFDALSFGDLDFADASDTDTAVDANAEDAFTLDVGSLLDMPEMPEDGFVRLGAADVEEAPADDDFAAAMSDFGFLDDAPERARAEVVPDLDSLLNGTSSMPPVAQAVAAARPAEQRAAAPTATPRVAPVAASAATSTPAKQPERRSLADFESALSRLSLVDDDAETAAPVAAAPAPAAKAQAPAAPSVFDSFANFSLEPLDGEGAELEATPASGRAQFDLGRDAALIEAIPSVVATPVVAVEAPIDDPLDDGLSVDGLDFDFDVNAEITTDSIVRMGASSEPALDDLSVDLDSEIESLLRDAAEVTGDVEPRIRRVWVLGASIGGPDAVREFLGVLPADVPALFLLAQHMGADFLDLMVQQLAKATALKVRSAAHGSVANPGEVVIVPLAERLEVDRDGALKISKLEVPSPYTPSIDRVMIDVANRFGADAGAIVFSGMAHDAIDGAKHMKKMGGTVWVQDPATCVISSMVDGALEAGVVSYQGKPADLARRFLAEVQR